MAQGALMFVGCALETCVLLLTSVTSINSIKKELCINMSVLKQKNSKIQICCVFKSIITSYLIIIFDGIFFQSKKQNKTYSDVKNEK